MKNWIKHFLGFQHLSRIWLNVWLINNFFLYGRNRSLRSALWRTVERIVYKLKIAVLKYRIMHKHVLDIIIVLCCTSRLVYDDHTPDATREKQITPGRIAKYKPSLEASGCPVGEVFRSDSVGYRVHSIALLTTRIRLHHDAFNA